MNHTMFYLMDRVRKELEEKKHINNERLRSGEGEALLGKQVMETF